MRFIIISVLFILSLNTHSLWAQNDVSKGGLRIEAIDKTAEAPADAQLTLSPIKGLTNKNISPMINFTQIRDVFKKKSGVRMVQKSDLVQPTWTITQKFGEDQKDLSKFNKDFNLGSLSTTSKFIIIKCRDHEYVDGDRIKLMLNKVVIHPNIILKGDYFVIDVDLVPGYNSLNFIALNEGASSPNTAQLKVYDEEGSLLASNKWLIRTGYKASLSIYKE